MSWLGTVSTADVVTRGIKRLEREYTLFVGTAVSSVSIQYAMATTYYWGGMDGTAASNWVGTLEASTSPAYSDIAMDRVDESGQYGVVATIMGTWAT
jgi:hypothetical protein